jgi:hypothetical protein
MPSRRRTPTTRTAVFRDEVTTPSDMVIASQILREVSNAM